jgi:alpha-glucosidase (family GH31 glycosyl hydrolase)
MAGLVVTAPEPATASAAGTRADRHAVRSGDARFEVLSPTLIRMEYAGNGTFTDAATFNAIGRDDFGRTPFTEKVAGGWLTIDTDRLTLKYKVGSGPFTAQNVSVRLRTGNQMVTGHPTWPAPATCAAGTLCEAERTAPGAPYPSPAASATPCDYGAVCEAENGALTGGAALNTDHNGYSGGGFVAGLQKAGATDTVSLRDIPADGRYALQIRYGNGSSPATARTISTAVNGGTVTSTSLPATADWDTWSTATIPVTLTKGSDTVAIGCPAPDGCHVNLDTVAVTSTESPVLPPHSSLGGYRRGLDGVNGGALTTPGLLYRDGWYLLDDTASAVLDTATRTVHQRPSRHGKSYQDGYLFGYGQDYKQGLADLKTLTGPSKLLPRWAYGVWYSEYHDYTAANYQQTILPKFRSDGVPLDVLVTDTDFKAPNAWNGWEIDPSRFPDPKAFFDWSRSQGLHNTLNIHPSIVSSDPRFAQAQATAKGRLTNVGGCLAGAGFTCYTFDWSDPNQLKAYLDLHRTMEKQGADFWWLDWCCESSRSSMPGVTPDAWINQQYASDTAKNIGRGFAFSRAFGSLQAGGYSGRTGVPTGPWADKRTTVHFTGDTTSGWQTLRFETGYTPSESASTGLSPVSHDIGGFNGPSKLSDDLYVRWVQLGAFQPIMRLHGSHSDRLPWQYSDPARVAAEKFLNLRENLLPYTYTLAREAADTGVPAVRATYLEYPGQQGAYDSASKEYFYGSDVLVAPATSPGATATTSVWFPPGQWTDFFTGRTYTGPSTQNITTDWNSMPVFVKAGGIVPTRTDNVTNDVQNPLTKVTLNVAEGAGGSYSLHEDDGRSTAPNRSATTAVRYTENRRDHVLHIAPVRGTFKSQVTRRQWTVAFTNAAAPTVVHIDGVRVPAANWTFDKDRRTLTVTVPTRSVSTATTISYS